MEGAWRQRNENASGASDPPFSTIPLLNSPLYNENELRFSAQQSRIAFKASGDIDPTQHVAGYYEMDFLGGAPTGNSRESNSYNPRIRQLWFSYDNDYWHSHFSAGQMWSLLTQNRVGIINQTENIPLTIDAQYVTGFNWARQPAIRFVEDWGKIAWFGVSVECSETGFASNGNGVAGAVATSANAGTVVPPTVVANVTNNCNAAGLLDPLTNCSINPTPDIIEKFALDPGWGHYEALGLQRWFADATAPAVGGVAVPGGSWSQRMTFGWGVGGNALLPVWPKFVDLQGSVLYGQGIGRYASGQLADVVVGPTGNLQPLTTVQFLVGAVAHPFAGNDIYVYYGQEQTQANAWTVGATQGGWGNSAFDGVLRIGELRAGTATGEQQRRHEHQLQYQQHYLHRQRPADPRNHGRLLAGYLQRRSRTGSRRPAVRICDAGLVLWFGSHQRYRQPDSQHGFAS